MISQVKVYNCDFCGTRIDKPGTWQELHAHSFEYRELHNTHLMSEGSWCACLDCASLVNTEQWRALEDKSVASLARDLSGVDHAWLRGEVQTMHRQFRASRFKPKSAI